MYKVKGLKDFGTWLTKGEMTLCPDNLTISLSKREILRPIEYHLNVPNKRWNMRQTLMNMEEEVRVLQLKIKAYKKFLSTTQNK